MVSVHKQNHSKFYKHKLTARNYWLMYWTVLHRQKDSISTLGSKAKSSSKLFSCRSSDFFYCCGFNSDHYFSTKQWKACFILQHWHKHLHFVEKVAFWSIDFYFLLKSRRWKNGSLFHLWDSVLPILLPVIWKVQLFLQCLL